jgi:hypothetical protein
VAGMNMDGVVRNTPEVPESLSGRRRSHVRDNKLLCYMGCILRSPGA